MPHRARRPLASQRPVRQYRTRVSIRSKGVAWRRRADPRSRAGGAGNHAACRAAAASSRPVSRSPIAAELLAALAQMAIESAKEAERMYGLTAARLSHHCAAAIKMRERSHPNCRAIHHPHLKMIARRSFSAAGSLSTTSPASYRANEPFVLIRLLMSVLTLLP